MIPRSLVHRGVVLAWGVWFPPGTARLLERVLPLWGPGVSLFEAVHEEGWGHVLQFSQPRRVVCEGCPGLALVSQGSRICSFVSSEDIPADGLHLYWQGRQVELSLAQLRPYSPPLKGLFSQVIEGRALARPAGPPTQIVAATFVPRQDLPAVPPPSPKLQILLESWSKSRAAAPIQAAGPLLQWAGALWGKLTSVFSSNHNERYLREMVDLFESGNLSEALRYGIPLGGLAPDVLRRQLGWLRPRENLSMGQKVSTGSVIPVSLNGESYLRALYRKAAEQLVQAGQIEEAVFVYSELLNEHWEALRVLEENKRYELAARLAEARDLPAATQIRLWFLAGNVDRAMEIARRKGQHLQVYQELVNKKSERAVEWLEEWGLSLLRGNRHAAALQLLWPQRQQLPQLRQWLSPALTAGGPEAGRVMALWISDPQGQEQFLLETCRGWLEDDDLAIDGRLWGLIEGLRALPFENERPLLEKVSGLCARAALKRAPSSGTLTQNMLNDLVRISRDPLLKTDQPALPPSRIKPDVAWQELLRGQGTSPIWDAALLPDGRLLCALGEAGLAVVSARGRLISLLPVPTQRIVIPWAGDRYILLAPQGPEWRIAWLEARTLSTRPWVRARLADFCDHYDGDSWLVILDDALYQMDAHSTLWRSLWKVPLGGPVTSMTLAKDKLGMLLAGPKNYERMARFHSYPDLQLRNQRSVPNLQANLFSVTEDSVVEARFDPSYAGGLEIHGHRLAFQEAPVGPLKITHGSSWSLVEAHSPLGTQLLAVSRAGRARPANFWLRDVTRVAARLQGQQLVIADDQGGCRVADLQRRTWVRNTPLRLT